MAESKKNEYKPYIECRPGDFITAKDMNDMQKYIRASINEHAHNGKGPGKGSKDNGGKIDGSGITDDASLSVKDLELSGKLTVTDTLEVKKQTTAHDLLTVKGNLSVNGITELTGKVTLTDSLEAQQPCIIHEKLTVKGALEVTETAELKGKVTLTDNLAVKKSVQINGELTVKDKITTTGAITAAHIHITNSNLHRMYPLDALVYRDIFDAKRKKAISKYGKPHYDDTTYTKKNLWHGQTIIRFGNDNQGDSDGALVKVPKGYNTLWVRVLGERWAVMKAYFIDGDKEQLGLWCGGFRQANNYCPDGSLSDAYHTRHQWVPIPVGRSGNVVVVAKKGTTSHFWVSGVGFSRNPWNHASQSVYGIHLGLNGAAAGAITMHKDTIWQGDILGLITKGSKTVMKVPVIPSGKDKLLYIAEHNNYWNGCMHNGITVNGKPIERFLATYDNPFARHWNSKFYDRYIAARIPAKLISKSERFLDVLVDMSKQDHNIYFREIGTHDFDLPNP